MSRSLLRIATVAATAVALSSFAIAPASAQTSSDDDALLITLTPADAERFPGLDIVSATDQGVVVLGDADLQSALADESIEPVFVQTYASSLSEAAAPRSASRLAAAATVYPVPERLGDKEYDTFFGGYRTVDAYTEFANDIADAYPELVELVDFGDSWLKTNDRGGDDLLAVRITSDVEDQPAADNGQEGKPRFVLVAQAHAREIITSELAWRYATELLDGYGTDAQITSLLDSTEVWINFQNNPDGIRLVQGALATASQNASGDATPASSSKAWQRKNQNDTLFAPTSSNWSSQQSGVDLNRNWGFHWGEASSSTNPNAADYRGTAPHSEPEISALSGLLTDLFGEFRTENTTAAPDDRAGTYVNLHSYSNYVIYPYAYSATDAVPNLAAIKANAFRQSFANNFATGKAGEILYNNSGNDIDWIYSQLGVPAYTYEIGTAQTGGFFPAYTRVQNFWNTVSPGIRFAAEAAYEPYTAGLGGVVQSVDAVRGEDGSVSVSGVASDTAYGSHQGSANRRPAVTDITAVEAALATDRNAITDTVPLTIGAAAQTVDFTGTLAVTRENADANSVFVRAKNGTGQWGPWESAFAPAVSAPEYTGETSFEAVAGVPLEATLAASSSVAPQFTVVAGALPDGVSLDAATGALSGTPTRSGTFTADVSIDNGAGEPAVASLTFTVDAGALDSFVLSVSDEKPNQGDSITVTAFGIDEYGNEISDYSDRVEITSDVATDLIEGNTVTFPTASPHTLTATFEGVSSSILVQVTPAATGGGDTDGEGEGEGSGPGSGSGSGAGEGSGAGSADPDALATTGAEIGGWLTLTLTLLLAGAGVLLIARRRATS